MKNFEVAGEFKEGGINKKFSIVLSADNKNYAAEKAMCILGSKHKKARREIFVKEVKEKR